MGGEPVEIIRLPEGESGLGPATPLTERVLQSLASFWAIPERERRKRFGTRSVDDDIAFLASRLGVSRAFIRRSLRSRRLLDRIGEELNAAAILLVPSIIQVQAEKAIMRGDGRAAELVLRYLGKMNEGRQGVTVNVGVGVNVQHHEQAILQDQENLAFLRDLRDSGELQRLIGPGNGVSDTG